MHYLSRKQLAAVAHPLRQKVLDLLVERGELSGREIVELIPGAPSNPCYHLEVLRKARLIRVVRTAPRRGVTEKYYAAIARTFSLRPQELLGTRGRRGRPIREGIVSVAREGVSTGRMKLFARVSVMAALSVNASGASAQWAHARDVMATVEAWRASWAVPGAAVWFVGDYAGRPLVDHIGGHGGMVALVTLLPEDDIGVAVLTNHGDNLLPVAVTNHVLDLLLGLETRPWNDTLHAFWDGVRKSRAASALAPGGERRQAPPSLQPADYAGSYASPAYGETRIEARPDELVLVYGSNLVGVLSHWHHDTFRVSWVDPFMRAILGPGFASFDLDMAGRPARLTWTGLQGELIESLWTGGPER